MNSKNIPTNIKNKSIEEAQKEVSEIIEILEKEENLENSIKKYHRLILLNTFWLFLYLNGYFSYIN